MGPLTDVTVLDLTHYIAGPYATKLLADYGADVIKVEPPDGDPARRLGPFKDDRPGPERSGTFFYLNTNKRSVALDLRRPEGREVFARLLDRADLVVESFRPGVLDRLGVGWSFIHQRRPDLPLVSISNFGQESPYRDYQGSDLVLYALAGEMYSMGVAEREPVKMYGTAALIESGSAAAVAAMAALEVARGQGVGQHVDFSIADSHFCGVDRRHATVTAYDFCGRKTLRAAGGATGFANGVYPCADGYVEFANAGLRLDRLADMLGHPEWLQDPKWYVPGAAMNPDLVDEFNAYFYAWLLERTKREVWEEARRAKVLCGPLFTVEDLFHDPHFRSRGFWQQVQHPELGTVDLPGRPFIMADSPWELRRPAPLLGQHTAEVLAEAGYSPAEVRQLAEQGVVRARTLPSPGPASPAPARREGAAVPRGGADRARLPLAGVRVLDFTVVWAGPFATMLLGDLGAEIIKVENAHVWQPMTRGALARPPQVLLDTGAAWGFGYPNGRPGPRPWNYSPTFVNLYRNKKSCTMDLRRPEGMEILARLVARCDVVYENNAVDTLEKLGITYDWLRSIREDIIMVRAPAYGLTGPYAGARALGVHLEGVMGHTLLRGYPDLDPSVSTAIYSGDYLAGCQGAL
ncbi:MAG TPA: CoA transferase, partial [Dehalococcoidia bacterium]